VIEALMQTQYSKITSYCKKDWSKDLMNEEEDLLEIPSFGSLVNFIRNVPAGSGGSRTPSEEMEHNTCCASNL